jgi:hypothetical protein
MGVGCWHIIYNSLCQAHLLCVHCLHSCSIVLILGSLKSTLSDGIKVLEKSWGATCEHGALYSKACQEVADILSILTNIAEAQNRYCNIVSVCIL